MVFADSDSSFQVVNLYWGWEERNNTRKKQKNVGSRLSYTTSRWNKTRGEGEYLFVRVLDSRRKGGWRGWGLYLYNIAAMIIITQENRKGVMGE